LLLVDDRRVSGQLVEVSDDAGRYAEHAGTVERDVFRVGIGLGPQVHDDQFPAIQTLQSFAAPAVGVPLARESGPKVGQRLLT
jgi:hypothetical protein